MELGTLAEEAPCASIDSRAVTNFTMARTIIDKTMVAIADSYKVTNIHFGFIVVIVDDLRLFSKPRYYPKNP